MNIRLLRYNETDFLYEMLYEAIFITAGQKQPPRSILQDPALSKYLADWGKDEFDIALVLEDRGQLIGAIWGRLFTLGNKGFGFVDEQTPELGMAIRAAYRNRGLGSQLLDQIAEKYRLLGIKSLSLSVDKANPAVRLYQRAGFEIFEEKETAYTMRKDLSI